MEGEGKRGGRRDLLQGLGGIDAPGNQDPGSEIELSRVAENTLKHACANV